jgi:hypothetical protein
MNSDWLQASSFEQMQAITSAITTLSINAKLTLAGRVDPTGPDEVEQARDHLIKFLKRFQLLVRDAENEGNGVIMGADPRLGELAARYLAQKQRGHARSPLYTLSFADLGVLLEARRPEDLPVMIAYLHDLRVLVEQHTHVDVIGLLGDV